MLHIEFFVLGFLIAISLFNIIAFLGRRNDISIFAFSLLTLSYAFVLFYRMILPAIGNDSNFLKNIFDVISIFWISGSTALFFHYTFNLKKIFIFTVSYYIALIVIGAFLFMSCIFNLFYPFIYIIFNISAAFYAFIFLVLVLIQIYKLEQFKKLKNKLIILGFIVMLSSMSILSIIWALKIEVSVFFSYSPFLFMVIIVTYALTDNFNREHRDLIDLKNTLESRVNERTRELQIAKTEIEEKEKHKTSFFINFAHETKTPLTLIGNYLDKLENYLKSKPADMEVNRSLDIILNNYERMQRDIVNFLDVEKLLKGRMLYNHGTVTDIKQTILQKIELFAENAGMKNISVKYSLEDACVKIDPFAFDRIINNLLDNAVRYNRQNGSINIDLKVENAGVILKISDTGIGMSKKQLEDMFEPFRQMSLEKSNLQGMGVGLSIVREIVKQADGEIHVESRKNNGTSFTVMFKASGKKAVKPPAAGTNRIIAHGNTVLLPEKTFKKDQPVLLIVEDNPELLSYLQSELYELFNIYTAVGGQNALEKIKSTPKPDIIVSDIMMDGMDGYEFCRRIRKSKKYNNVPFIFLTAKTTDEDRKLGYIRGADDYITKPFKIGELYLKIEKILERKPRIIRELRQKRQQGLKSKFKQFNITAQEQKIILLLKNGMENKEMSKELKLSESTIRNHMHNIFFKTRVKTRIELNKLFN